MIKLLSQPQHHVTSDVPVAPLVVPAVVCDAVVNVVGVVALSKTHRVLVYFKIMFELAHMVDNTTDT